MSDKTILCRCADLTLDDVEGAMDDGYTCFEDLKRFLGLATGPCQGKACVQVAMQLIATRNNIKLDEVDLMTFRPPVRPISFATLAAPDAEDS
jgi:bacterioferritin-associated ferredoxin